MLFEEKGIYTVHEFTQMVKSTLTSRFNDVWIRGEISNYTYHNSGHRYFTLKDKKSQLRCVMFRWYARNLRFEPHDGMKVIVYGDIDVYEPKGEYQLKVSDIRPDGVGELYKAYEQLKNKLALEGLFSPHHKKPLPRFPEKIGIATSDSGAVIHDILTVLKRRYPVSIVFAPTIVQGKEAAESIVRSLELLNQTDVDVIILGRGGGSIEDLWAFNEEKVARAIFNSRIPVISAVGHETDYTIADFVADVRAPTPSAAAEIAVPHREELLNYIKLLSNRMIQTQKERIHERFRHLYELREAIEPVLIEKTTQYMHNIDTLSHQMVSCINRILENKKELLKMHANRLNAISPLATLERGYSITLKLPEKLVVRSINDVGAGDKLQIVVNDGRINCRVIDKEACIWR